MTVPPRPVKALFTQSLTAEELIHCKKEDIDAHIVLFTAQNPLPLTNRKFLHHLSRAAALVFSSKHAVGSMHNILNRNLSAVNQTPVYAFGRRVSAMLENLGVIHKRLQHNSINGLYTELLAMKKDGNIVHFCGNLTHTIVAPAMVSHITFVEVYITTFTEEKVKFPYDCLVFFSPSAIRGFLASGNMPDKKMPIFVPGKTTGGEAKKYFTNRIVTSSEPSVFSTISCISSHYFNEKPCIFRSHATEG